MFRRYENTGTGAPSGAVRKRPLERWAREKDVLGHRTENGLPEIFASGGGTGALR